MFPSKKRARIEFKQSDRQWLGLESVQEKIESMQDNVLIYLCQNFRGKMEVNGIEGAIIATKPETFDHLSSGSIHGRHAGEDQPLIKKENSKRRKRTNDHNCEKCHNEINEIYYRWLTQASQVIKMQLKKTPPVETVNVAQYSKTSKSKNKGKQRAISLERDEMQNNSDSTINAEDESNADCPICCNENIPAQEMTKCVDGHRFCKSCARRLAETEIGFQRTRFQCMHMQGCEAFFSEVEIKRFLDEKAFQLWSRLRTNEDLKSAKIDGLESCPFCFYSYVVYPEDRDKPFFCRNNECGKWSCMHCKKLFHEGKSCEEARQANMTSEHKAEEKLAEALMRRCPKAGCNTVMVKDEGARSCNKMSCVKCKTIMCYICRKDITKAGYGHFDHNSEQVPVRHQPGNKAGRTISKCPLWDDTKERHKKDVNNARKEVGKLAPKVTKAEIEDEGRRQQAFERRHGENAAHVPGEWGFPDDNVDIGVEMFAARRFALHHHPPRRLGEGLAQAMDRHVQEEADRREAERGDPQAFLLERERQLRERDRELGVRVRERERARLEQIERELRNVNQPNLGYHFHLHGGPNAAAVQEWNNDVQQEAVNAMQMNIQEVQERGEGFARRLEILRRSFYEIEGELGQYRAQLGDRRLNAPIAVPQVNQAIPGPVKVNHPIVAHQNVRLRYPTLAQWIRGAGLEVEQAHAPTQKMEVKNIDTQANKEKASTRPDMKLRKVASGWQWLERSATPKETAGTQTREDKGEGSSKNKSSTANEGAEQAGRSRATVPQRSNDVIDLTMSSDEDSEEEDDFGLIYL